MAYDPVDPHSDNNFSGDAFPGLGGYSPDESFDNPYGQGFPSTGSSSEVNPLLPTYGQGFPSTGSSSEVNPLLPTYGQGSPSTGSSSEVNPLLPTYGQGSPSTGSSSEVNPLLPTYGQGSPSTSNSSEVNTVLPPYGQRFDTQGSYPSNNTTSSPYGQGFDSGRNDSSTTSSPYGQGFDTTTDDTVPYDSGMTAPRNVMTVEDYVPDEYAIKQKRKQFIGSLIHLAIGAVCVGAFFYFLFQTTKGSSSSADTIGTYLTWGFVAVVGIIALRLILRLVAFLKNPSDKRYYKYEAQQAVRQSRYEQGRQRYLNAHRPQQSYDNSSVVSTSGHSSTSKKKNQPVSYGTARAILLVSLLILLAGAVTITIFVAMKIDNDHFIDRAVPISATIVDRRAEKHTHRHKHGPSTTSYSYYATVEYDYNGSHYRAGEFSVAKSDTIGTHIQLYIDPNNPSDCRDQFTSGSLIWSIVAFLPLVLFGSVGAYNGIVLMKKAKRREQEGR